MCAGEAPGNRGRSTEFVPTSRVTWTEREPLKESCYEANIAERSGSEPPVQLRTFRAEHPRLRRGPFDLERRHVGRVRRSGRQRSEERTHRRRVPIADELDASPGSVASKAVRTRSWRSLPGTPRRSRASSGRSADRTASTRSGSTPTNAVGPETATPRVGSCSSVRSDRDDHSLVADDTIGPRSSSEDRSRVETSCPRHRYYRSEK